MRVARYIITVLVLLILANLPFVRYMVGDQDCNFSSAKGGFTYEEMNLKGRDFATCLYRFEQYKHEHPKDGALYRLCAKKPWAVWNYYSYAFSGKYRLPYKPWSEIEAARGPIEVKTGFQDF